MKKLCSAKSAALHSFSIPFRTFSGFASPPSRRRREAEIALLFSRRRQKSERGMGEKFTYLTIYPEFSEIVKLC